MVAVSVGAVNAPAVANEPVEQWAAKPAAPSAPPVHAASVSRSADRGERAPHVDPAERLRRAARHERRAHDIAEAATWQVDPALLEPRPTDSAATAAARAQLAVLAGLVRERVAAYDAAREAAAAAADAAGRAQEDLSAAREAVAVARARFQAHRDALVTVLTEDYAKTQLAPLAAVLAGDDDGSLPDDLTMLQEMGRIQDRAVGAAERARSRLAAAEHTYAAAAETAEGAVRTTRAAALAARQARDDVVGQLEETRSLVMQSALADLVTRVRTGGGYRGRITFPLPPGTPFVDQDNFGGRSGLWAREHTGDDFSTACGSPVVAANAGTVMIRTDQGWSGRWLVMVSTARGSLTTWYAHMQAIDVVDGQHVHAGDPLGQVGSEGNATGCHLHFEVHPTGGGIYEDDTDPEVWLHRVGAYPTGPSAP
jgi:murein DD-endopeptidase MepM/ murein hydrolase activator NlpD